MVNLYATFGKKTILTACAALLAMMSFAQSCLTISGSQTNVTCYGTATGSINVSATGGSGNYSYTWLGTGGMYTGQNRTNLIAGNYTVTVKDLSNPSCQATQSFVITEPSPLNIESINKTWHNGYGLSCANSTDGELTVFMNGGTGSYQYSLNDGPFQASNVFSNLPAGTYYTTVKDENGCLVTSDPNSPLPHSVDYVNPLVTIEGPAPLSASPVTVLPVAAGNDDSIVIFASQTIDLVAGPVSGGVAPYTYLWSPFTGMGSPNSTTITVAPATTTLYTLTITDASGCVTTRTFKVVVNSISGGGGSGGGGNTGGGGGGNRVTVCHNGKQMSVSLSALPAHVRHGDNIGFCSPYGSKAIVTAELTDHSELAAVPNVIYPNPSKGKFAIRLTHITGKLDIQVVNALGIVTEKRVISNAVEESIQQFDLTGKPSGVYFIKVTGASLKQEVYRVLIK